MINCKAITFALFSAVFAMSASASAEQLGLRSAVATPEASAEHASKARLTAFKQAEISLGNAISIAESTIGGNRNRRQFPDQQWATCLRGEDISRLGPLRLAGND